MPPGTGHPTTPPVPQPVRGLGPISSGALTAPSGGGRVVDPSAWSDSAVPLLRDPRQVVGDLHGLHSPVAGTVVLAVFDRTERLRASASFRTHGADADGWASRNALLDRLRRITPHELKLRVPARTAVLIHCRTGSAAWTPHDGAWMWGLRDACTLHGLRCGACITVTEDGWQVLGEGRSGRSPRMAADGTPTAVRSAPVVRGDAMSQVLRHAAAR